MNVQTHPVGDYRAKALYYEDADALEYVRADVPTVYRRIDQFLSLILDLQTREPIGFKIKGFKNFFLRAIKPSLGATDVPFLRLITVLEELMTELGDGVFSEAPRRNAYKTAAAIATQDQVVLSDFPEVA